MYEAEFAAVEQEGYLQLDLVMVIVDLVLERETGVDALEEVAVGTDHAFESGVKTHLRDVYA